MSETFIHGVQTIEISNGTRPIQTARSSIIGVVGTAPDADTTRFPLNQPVLVAGNSHDLKRLGTRGTLPSAAKMLFALAAPFVIFVRVEDDADANMQMSNVIGSLATRTGISAFLDSEVKTRVKPRILIAPGFTQTRPTDAVASVTVNEAGAGYSAETPPVVTIVGDGFGARARAVVVNGAVSAIIIENSGQGYTGAGTTTTLTIAGPQSGTQARATVVLGAAANPVAKELEAVATKLRAVVYVDGPNTGTVAAVSHRQDFGTGRIRVFDPHPMVWDTDQNAYVTHWASALAAGVQASVDLNRGFWWDLSNVALPLVGGISRPVEFNLTEPSTEANYLNENGITTLIRKNGFRFWGLQTSSTDPAWKFASVRRTADMIYESIENSILWALDRPITANTVIEIAESVRSYIRHLIASEALLGGDVWFDENLNTREQLQAGKVTLDFDIEPPAPLETLKFRAHRNNAYYEELVTEVIERLAA